MAVVGSSSSDQADQPDLSAGLHQQPLMPDLLITALERNLDKPCVYLGDTVLTARQVRDEISRYVQALESKGLGRGSPVAVLALNRPEVLFNMGAGMLLGCRTTPLHPMGSLDDHAYVLEDAGIETLVYDPEFFGERAAQLAERVPGLKTMLPLRARRRRATTTSPWRPRSSPGRSARPTCAPTTSPAWPTPAAPPASPRASWAATGRAPP